MCAVLQDGHWVSTPEGLERAAARLEKHRADCRDRYRVTRDALKEQRLDPFKGKRRRTGTAALNSELPLDPCDASEMPGERARQRPTAQRSRHRAPDT